MSNSLAISTVTGALVTRFKSLLNGVGLTDLEVIAGHPKSTPDSGVYVTLFHLAPNPALRNLDLPTRRSDGEASLRPMLALNLRYLFSFVGDPAKYEGERLAGLILSDLHARPMILPDEITGFLGALSGSHYLRASDLARQPERIKLTPLNLDTEELSRVWGLFNQSLFALSMAWEATAVLLDGTLAPAPALPVATTTVVVAPVTRPVLSRLYEATTRQQVVALADFLVLEGTDLLGERTRLFIGAANREVGMAELQEGRLRIAVASVTGLLPGIHPVFIEHRLNVPGAAGDGLRPAGSSNVLALMVLPTLGAASAGAVTDTTRPVSVVITPLPLAEQSAELVLQSTIDGTRRSSRNFNVVGAAVVFAVRDLPVGTYLVRVSIDGAASLPTMAGGVYTGPTLVVS